MEEIKISDLPEYAKNSNMYEGMDEDEKVEIPPKFLIYDEKINSFKEYKRLIRSYNYFLSDLSDEIIKFQKNPENEDDVLEFLIKNKDSAFYKEQLDTFQSLKIEVIDFDYMTFLKYKYLCFNLRYTIKERNFKLKIDEIYISEEDSQYILNQIKNLESFELPIRDSKSYYYQTIYVDFIENKVKFTIKTQETSIELNTNKISIEILINFYEKLMKYIKKFKILIKSKKFFGIINDSKLKIGLSIGRDDLYIKNIHDFFDYINKYNQKYNQEVQNEKITKNNIEEYLINKNRIIYLN
uniref:Uncharacterized protein n=1 Tax=viral metagenome TaxID=1070528 RepID=A0A6C0AD10_9ZZZZ